MAIKLGDKVKDPISGFEGVVVGRTDWLWGCVQLGVQPAALHEGKPVERQWFDETALEVIENRGGGLGPNQRPTGGPTRIGPPARTGR